jgi:hypothetical protein
MRWDGWGNPIFGENSRGDEAISSPASGISRPPAQGRRQPEAKSGARAAVVLPGDPCHLCAR